MKYKSIKNFALCIGCKPLKEYRNTCVKPTCFTPAAETVTSIVQTAAFVCPAVGTGGA